MFFEFFLWGARKSASDALTACATLFNMGEEWCIFKCIYGGGGGRVNWSIDIIYPTNAWNETQKCLAKNHQV